MAVVKMEMEIAKEVDEVMVLVKELIADIKAGKNIATIAAENVQHLVAAVNNVDQIPDEVAEKKAAVLATVGYRAGEIAGMIIG